MGGTPLMANTKLPQTTIRRAGRHRMNLAIALVGMAASAYLLQDLWRSGTAAVACFASLGWLLGAGSAANAMIWAYERQEVARG